MHWKRFVHHYFAAVHQSWMDGNYERLRPFYTYKRTAYSEREQQTGEWERLNREHSQMTDRGASIQGVSGRVVPLCWMETREFFEITVSWQGWRHYRLKGSKHAEATHRLLRLLLDKAHNQWKIAETREWDGDAHTLYDDELDERRGLRSVDDAVMQPLLVVHGAGGYNSAQAVTYAERYWNTANPAYPHFTDDCTNFISQCLHAGGIPMLFSKEKGRGWWMRTGKNSDWSYSWAVAHSFYLLLKSGGAPMRAVKKDSPDQLVPGDIICYDFDGDGRYQHSTIVVAKDENNMPLVNAHTTDSSMRYWKYEDSTAYTPNIRYSFFHIRGM